MFTRTESMCRCLPILFIDEGEKESEKAKGEEEEEYGGEKFHAIAAPWMCSDCCLKPRVLSSDILSVVLLSFNSFSFYYQII